MPDLDIVGGAAVDVVPIVPQFHTKLKALILPIADRVGREAGERMGQAISNSIVIAIPSAINAGGNAAQTAATRQGSDVGGAFARSIRAKLTAAFRAMPKLDIRLGDAGVDAELARLRARMEALSNKRIGIDIDAADAERQIIAIDAELRRLGAQHPNVAVRADTATARAALADIRAEIAAVDASDVDIKIDVNAREVRTALLAVAIQAAALVAIPIGPVLAAGLGAVVSAATAAGSALGALGLASIPAIKGVTEAMQAQTQAQKDVTKETSAGINAGVQAQQQALQMAAAQQALASARRSAASSIAAAADQVSRAERSLADAQQAELTAQTELTQARKTAEQQLRQLDAQLAGSALDQRAAALRVKEAKQELDATLSNGKSTDIQRERAQLAYDEAVQGLKDQTERQKELTTSAAAQRKAGVEGSDVVRRAQERVTEAQRATTDQAAALVKAQKAVAEAHVKAAEAITTAERGIAAARLSASKVTDTATSKTDAYEAALAKLTPSQRKLFDSIAGPQGLKAAYTEWQKSLQPQTLPIFTRGVDSAKASLPGLTGLVLAAARGVTTLMDKASAQWKSPFWVSFKSGITDSAEPAIVGLGVAIGNVFKGIAGIIDAFLPHMDGIASRSDSITARFAKWGTSLKGSPDFERFLNYVKETSPGLGKFLGDLLRAALDVGQALAPLSQMMFSVLSPIISAVSWLSTNAPGFIQILWGMYFAQKAITLGMAAFGAAMALYDVAIAGATLVTLGWAAAINATGIVPLIRAIVLVVGLLVVAIIWAYNNVGWFRTAVDTAWAGIKTATMWLWESVLKPAFAGIWWALKGIGAIAMWLWEKALGPAFRFIWEAAKILFQVVAVAVLVPLYLAFKVLGAIALWLWEKILGPVFSWIGEKAIWLWNVGIKPAFKSFGDQFRALGDAAMWLWEKVIRPVFSWIADKAMWLYEAGVKPHMDKLRGLLDLVSDAFGSTKDNIKSAWDQLKEITKGPVKFIVETVYNGGIVPVWNAVAKITGVNPIDKVTGFHTGGIMSGYSPGRDDRVIAVGGGEAVMRPEWTRAIGADRINAWNAAARSGGVGGVQRAISGGMPAYAKGGIVDWFSDKTSKVGSLLKGGWDALTDPGALFDEVTGGVRNQLGSLAKNPWAQAVGRIPIEILKGLKDKALSLLSFGGEGGGAWSKPVDAAYGTPFGKAGGMWSSGRHTGLDFPAAIGTIIRSVAGGKVTMARDGGPYGQHVMVNHGGGLSSLYAHMSQMLATVGQSVSQGQTIGRVGDTGNVTGPHLHLEARINGRAVDPMTYLSGGGGGGNGGSGVARWRGAVQHSLALLGQPTSLADTTLRRMNQESGGNPQAVNLWDSNAKAGTPSVGLMQVIRPTFDAYAGHMRGVGPKMYGVSTDPLANIFSSMRYAMSRYGSLSSAYNRPGGYAAGGFPGVGELAWVGEQGPELVRFLSPTQVYSHSDSMAMTRQASSVKGLARAGGGTAPVSLVAHVYVGDREITDIVDVRIEHREATAIDQLNIGRRL
ncbi:peptidoglycan DD-metalloendopeptidase family protein [Streptomyces sp. H27-H1]|uniref:peptidoglycan DD-metalloendopeptidase family protein n=1 Tax=Streptomyces sp. H27-H1 TaxID=2996461 RepID=UPI0022706910|nr:peptidoglycan DD-metalloendopeptidase family protein [Streptomyces sp. H27-H1]MCY0926219.1 peptidoglycan DD-metalloendopeptidase family protein [Streptomyces sp. H27-H1]